MIKKTSRTSGFWLSVGFVFVALFFAISFLFADVSKFFSHLHQFSYSVRNYDRDEAGRGIENLKSDYGVLSAWKLQYFSDRYLFNEMYRYEAAVSILKEDYEKVVNDRDLKNREGDYSVSYILGIAKFKIFHLAFQQAMIKKDKKQMAAILKLVLEQVRQDFGKCVDEGPGPANNFNCSFNYDLTSDPKAAQKALMSQKSKPEYVLAPPDEEEDKEKKPGGKKPDKKGPPQLSPDEKKNAGRGGAKKVG